MRYRLRTLLILLTFGPLFLACVYRTCTLDRMVTVQDGRDIDGVKWSEVIAEARRVGRLKDSPQKASPLP